MKDALILPAIFLLMLASCSLRDKKPEVKSDTAANGNAYAPAYALIREGQVLLMEGDLVFRDGQELTSQVIKGFSRKEASFSHVGIVFFEGGFPYVYHILSGEENPGEKLRKDSLIRSCNPRKNFGFGIARFDLSEQELQSLKEQYLEWYKNELKFDPRFSLQTDDRMYCTEIVYKGLRKASSGRLRFRTTLPTERESQLYAGHLHTTPAELRKMEIVAIDNLLLHPACREIKRYHFSYQ